MSPDRFYPDETELAVETLVIKKNGRTKTANDVFEIVVAMHHDAKKRDALILTQLEKHCEQYVHFDEGQLSAFVKPFETGAQKRDKCIAELKEELDVVKDEVDTIVARQPRRRDDPPEASFETMRMSGVPVEDTEMGDMRRMWRVTRWALLIAAAPFLIALGDHLHMLIFE